MKKLFLLAAIALCFIPALVCAEDTYTHITQNGQVADVKLVEVERSIPQAAETSMLSVARVDSFIADWVKKKEEAEAMITMWQAVRPKVAAEAGKVTLSK